MTDLQRLALSEIRIINRTLAAHGVRAGVPENGSRSLLTPRVHIHGVVKMDDVTVDAVLRRQPEITDALSEHRRVEQLPVRMDTSPITIELPSPAPVDLDHSSARLTHGPMQMVAGRTYSIYNGAGQLDLDLNRQHHIMVAGQTGAGKSVLLQMLLLSLCRATSPADLQLWLVDLKRDDLFALRHLPHVAAVAEDIPAAARLIARLGDVRRRRIAGDDHGPRILLAVDEQAELRGERDAIDEQNSLLSLGRSLRINLLLATQRPTKENLGGLNLDNITTRLVGSVADAATAAFITRRGGTGAENLARPGGFLAIDGPTVTRFQSYNIPGEDVADIVGWIGDAWRTVDRPQRVDLAAAPVAVSAEPDTDADANLVAVLAEQARPVFTDYYDKATGDLKYGGLSAIITALYGPGANTGGSNRRTAIKVVEHLKTATTTTKTAQIIQLPRRAAAGKR